jgi:hypothetical protein
LRAAPNGGSALSKTGIPPRIVTICRAAIIGIPGDNADVMTIVVSGPPATGKTTLGLALGRALAAPVFSRDPIMAVLYRRRWPLLGRGSVPAMGLELQTVLLARQLELGQPAILECVAPAVACDDRRSGHRSSPWSVCAPTRGAPCPLRTAARQSVAPHIGLGQGGRDDAPLPARRRRPAGH